MSWWNLYSCFASFFEKIADSPHKPDNCVGLDQIKKVGHMCYDLKIGVTAEVYLCYQSIYVTMLIDF